MTEQQPISPSPLKIESLRVVRGVLVAEAAGVAFIVPPMEEGQNVRLFSNGFGKPIRDWPTK